MAAYEYDYRGVPTIRRFAQSNAFIRGLVGPFGSGKSSGCVVEIGARGREQPPAPDGIRRTRWAVVRNTYPELADTTIKTFFQWFPPQYFGRWRATERKYTITAFPQCEIEVLFRALDDAEDVKRLLSLDLTGAWLNEVREIPWPIVEAMQGRVGRYPTANDGGPGWFGIIMDTNPPDIDSRFYRFFEEGGWHASFENLRRTGAIPADAKPEDFAAVFHQPSGLSPQAENLPNLPKGYYERLVIDKSDEWVKVYVKGEYGFVSENKRVYPEYDDRRHLTDHLKPVPGLPICRGWDFGLTPCCALSQVLPDGRWFVFDEIVSEDMGIDTFSDAVLEHCSRAFRGPVEYEDDGDPAGMQRAQTDMRTCFEILQAKGIDIQPGMQTLKARLESVRRPMMRLHPEGAYFVLHRRCKTIRKAFLGGYHYRRLTTAAERFSDKPEKNHPYSDIINGLEYTATRLFGGGLTQSAQEESYPVQRSMVGRSNVTGY